MFYLSIKSKVASYIKEAIINAWRFLNGQLDAIAYKLLSWIYDFFRELSELYLYNERIMSTIGKRVGLVLGIFVLFRLAVALVSYIIDPDKLTDSSKGTKKIITNIIISLSLLATVNIIFKEAYIIQKKIVSSQVIEKMFFGGKAETEDIDLSFYLYSAFLQVNLKECENDDVYNGDNISAACQQKITNTEEANRLIVGEVLAKRSFRPILAKYDNINETVDGEYLFDYTPVISLICAIIAILMLLSSCMDVATRMVKLLFLQIIAPIPIVSNMAPGKGEETFKKWYKECINTYLSLFIRIAVISFAIFLIALIKTEFSDIFAGRNILIQVILIIGCLMFAKQAPKLIENIFGIKMEGMTLNPLKKFQNEALFGKNITGLAAAGVAGTAAFGANAIATEGNIGKKLLSGVGGAGSAFARGTTRAIKGEKIGQVYSGAYRGAITARNNRDSRQKLGVKASDVWANNFQRKLGMDTEAERQDANVKMYDEFVSSGEAVVSISESEVQKHANKIRLDDTTKVKRFSDAGFDAATQTELRNANIDSSSFSTLAELREAMSDSNRYNAKVRAALNSEYERIKGDAEKAYREYATKGSEGLHNSAEFSFIDSTDVNGETAKAHISNVNDIFDRNKNNEVFVKNNITSINGGNIKENTKKVKYESTSVKNSAEYRKAHKIQEQTNREKK